MKENMRTKPFNASEYDPARDRLVCGSDPVTELIVGTYVVGGKCVDKEGGCEYVYRWIANTGAPVHGDCAPLEVLIPEPEKPSLLPCPFCGSTHILPDGLPGMDEVPTCDDCGARADRIETWNRREVPNPEEAKAVEPAELFDGFAVLQELSPKARTRTDANNVGDVLDAIVRLMRRNRAANGRADGGEG